MGATFYESLEKWLADDKESPHGLPCDINRMKAYNENYITSSIDDGSPPTGHGTTTNVEPQLLNTVARAHNCEKQELTAILVLPNGKYVARTFPDPPSPVRFFLFDEVTTGEVLLQFEWPLQFCFSHVRWGLHEGFRLLLAGLQKVSFVCNASTSGRYVVVRGPATKSSGFLPSGERKNCPETRILSVDSLDLKEMDLEHEGDPGWPASVALSPDPDREEEMTVLLSGLDVFQLPSWRVTSKSPSVLMQVNLRTRETISAFEERRYFTLCPQYLRGGDWLLCTGRDGRQRTYAWLFRSAGLIPLKTVDVSPFAYFTQIYYAWDVILSPCERQISVVFWRSRNSPLDSSELEEIGVASHSTALVYAFPINDVCKVLSLKQICRETILCNFDFSELDHLCLPKSCIQYIQGY